MDITAQEAIKFLETLPDYEKTTGYSYERDLRLERVSALLERLGNPQRSFSAVHIAGTRGKGSVAAMVYSVLKSSGLSVGLYTSPHLVSRRERIRFAEGSFQERTIADGELAYGILQIQPHLEALFAERGWEFTFFELFTALAFCFFKERGVSLAVLEVGMGGRLDATNVVTPLVSAITPISYDHTDKLGKTLTAIAGEKAGILKKGVPAVVAPQPEEALAMIRHVARQRETPLVEVGAAYRWGAMGQDLSGQRFWIRGPHGEFPMLESPLLGSHQLENAATALAICELLKEGGLSIRPSGIVQGFARVEWPGRFQIVGQEPVVVLDGAQNAASAEALRQTLSQIFPGRPCYLILGISADKEIGAICQRLCPMARGVIATRSQSVRALLPEALAEIARPYCGDVQTAPSLSEALRLARGKATPQTVLVVTGSLYLVGEALVLLKGSDA